MRFRKGVAIGALVTALVLLAAGAVLILVAGKTPTEWLDIEAIRRLVEEFEEARIKSWEWNKLSFTAFDGKENIYGPITATHVGCEIARAIKEDFLKYGYIESHNGAKAGFENDYEIVSIGGSEQIKQFFMKPKSSSSGRYEFYEYNDLNLNQQDALKGVCSDTSDLNFCGEFIDEKCISKILSNMKQASGGDGTFLCTGKGNKLVIGGTQESFGNDACTSSDSDPDYCTDVDECPGGDKIQYKGFGDYWGSDAKNHDPTIGEETPFGPDGFPPSDTIHFSGSIDKVKYGWVLLWNKKLKTYEVRVLKIPVPLVYVSKDLSSLASGLANDFNILDLDNRLGNVPQLRVRRHVIFKPSGEIKPRGLVESFLEDVSSLTSNTKWERNYEVVSCDRKIACLKNMKVGGESGDMEELYVGTRLKDKTSGVTSAYIYCSDTPGHISGDGCKWEQTYPDARKFKLRTEIPLDESLDSNTVYEAFLMDYGYVTGWKTDSLEKCGTGTFGEFCIKSNDGGRDGLHNPRFVCDAYIDLEEPCGALQPSCSDTECLREHKKGYFDFSIVLVKADEEAQDLYDDMEIRTARYSPGGWGQTGTLYNLGQITTGAGTLTINYEYQYGATSSGRVAEIKTYVDNSLVDTLSFTTPIGSWATRTITTSSGANPTIRFDYKNGDWSVGMRNLQISSTA